MKKLLVIPSWYPKPENKITGSFFQEQSKLFLNKYDVRVLVVDFQHRPRLNTKLLDVPRVFIRIIEFYLSGNSISKVTLPEHDDDFTSPPLYKYIVKITRRKAKNRIIQQCLAYQLIVEQFQKEGWSPDIVHAHSARFAGVAANWLKNEKQIPYVITEHMPFTLSDYDIAIREKIKNSFLEADMVLSLSNDKVRQLGMSGILVEPNLVFNLVDENEFGGLCERYSPGSPLKLVSIGAASFLKDHVTTLKAVLELKKSAIPFKLTLLGLGMWGDKKVHNEIHEFIRSNKLDSSVEVIDKMDRKAVPAILIRNNIFLMSSIAEGLPVSVLEAMASGLYIIATRHGGTEDILTKDTGSLVEVRNYKKISIVLNDIFDGSVLLNPQLERDHVVSLCGKDAFFERMSDYYEKVIEASS